jgi:hypothetical protein
VYREPELSRRTTHVLDTYLDPRGLGDSDTTAGDVLDGGFSAAPQDVGCGAALSAVLLEIVRSVASSNNRLIRTAGLLQAL